MSLPKVVITNRVDADVIAALNVSCHVIANSSDEPWSCADVMERSRNAVGLMAFMSDCVDREFLLRCPDLKIIASVVKGFDNFDVDACTERGIWLAVVNDRLTAATAELTIGAMIAVSRHIIQGDSYVRGAFRGWRPTFVGLGLEGSTVGVIGMGAIGQAIAQRLQSFQCSMVYFDQTPISPALSAKLGVRLGSFEELLKASDFLVLALPLNRGTQHLFDSTAIARIKPGCYLINTARGSIVDEEAVADALARGSLSGYAADVFEMEDWARPDRPSSVSPRLIADRDRTVLTPHIGSAECRTRRAAELEMANSILDYLAGRIPRGAVNDPTKKSSVRSCLT